MSSSEQMESGSSEIEDVQSTVPSDLTTDDEVEHSEENLENKDFSVSSLTLVGSPSPSSNVITHTQSLSAADEKASVSTSPVQTDSPTTVKAKRKTRSR